MKLLSNGYYISEGKYFEDWHAGHKDEGYIYSFLKINPNFSFVKIKRRNVNFDFIAFLKAQSKEELLKDTSTTYGKYYLKKDNKIHFSHRVMDMWDMEFELELISSELLKDKDGVEYHFIPVDEEKLKGLPEL